MKINDYMAPLTGAQSRIEQRKKAESKAPAVNARRFDTVTISSAKRAGEGQNAIRLRESITMDLRSATAAQSDRIAALREEIRSGTYQINPRAIAGRMLMLGEA